MIRLQQQLPNFVGLDLDRIYGCLLILCQMSWPSEKGIIVEVLKRIRAQRKFTFPLFFKYVINLELLEEFTYMYANEQDLVRLDLTGTSHPPRYVLQEMSSVVKHFRDSYFYFYFLFIYLALNEYQQEVRIRKNEQIFVT